MRNSPRPRPRSLRHPRFFHHPLSDLRRPDLQHSSQMLPHFGKPPPSLPPAPVHCHFHRPKGPLPQGTVPWQAPHPEIHDIYSTPKNLRSILWSPICLPQNPGHFFRDIKLRSPSPARSLLKFPALRFHKGRAFSRQQNAPPRLEGKWPGPER